MKATIESETAHRLSVDVLDNADDHHRITLDRNGDLQRHRCEASDPDDDPSDAHAGRADRSIRFAKYYCYRARDVDAIDAYGDDRIAYPERIATTILVVAAMTPGAVERRFEALYHQVVDETGPSERPVEPPTDRPDAESSYVGQDVFLDVDGERLQALLDATRELEAIGALRRSLDRYPERRSESLPGRLASILGSRSDGRSTRDGAASGGRPIVDTASLSVRWDGDDRTRASDEAPVERDTDRLLGARLQLRPSDRPIRSPAALQRCLVDHLCCQLRDCYVGMGLAPPRDLRIRGPGIAWFTRLYETESTEQRYHDPDAVVDWSQLAPVPKL